MKPLSTSFIEKRQAMSLGSQLSNIGSEVSPSLKTKKKEHRSNAGSLSKNAGSL